jgi:uncharacterized protein YciI
VAWPCDDSTWDILLYAEPTHLFKERIMRTRDLLTACLVGVALCASWLVTAQAADAADRSTFLIIYRPGSAWIPGKPVSEQGLADHFQYMLDLYEIGTLKQAGPFTDDSGGAVILEVADAAAARAVVANDPAVKANKMTPEIRPWHLVPWDQHLQKSRTKSESR